MKFIFHTEFISIFQGGVYFSKCLLATTNSDDYEEYFASNNRFGIRLFEVDKYVGR